MRIALLFLSLLLFTACSTGGGQAQTDSGVQPVKSTAGETQAYTATNYYLDFTDVLLPVELEYDDDGSFVFETRQHRCGFMKFSGRVDALSLFDFFVANMEKDGWTKVTSLKAKDSTLIFEKPSKSARIRIADEKFSTKVEVLVVEQR